MAGLVWAVVSLGMSLGRAGITVLCWFVTIQMGFQVVSRLSPTLKFYCNNANFVLCGLIASSTGILCWPYLWLKGCRSDTNWLVARTFYTLSHYLVGIEIEVEQEHFLYLDRPAVLIGNHQSMVDLCWLGRTFPRRAVILAKKSLQYIPFLGWFMTLADNIFLIRNNKQSIRDMFKEASNIVLKKQLSVFFFPEGTRGTHEKPDLLPFKKGAFILAVLSQIPIVPIVVMDMHNVVSNKYHRFPGGKLRVKVLSPIETKGKTEEDVPALMELARECMLKTLIEISPDRVDYTKGAKPKAQ